MGHASIAITMDVYGHLFPSGDDGSELAAAERAFLTNAHAWPSAQPQACSQARSAASARIARVVS
jgi:hypothetical protein